MPRVSIVNSNEVEPGDFSGVTGVAATGGVTTRNVVTGTKQPLHLWLHELAPGASLAWNAPPVGHVAFVWKGEVLADGRPVAREGVIVVEHGGKAVIEAGPGGATLAHFQSAEDRPGTPGRARAGGHAHVVGPEGIYQCPTPARHSNNILWADASCPTCELWLHQSKFGMPGVKNIPHYHTEDEIIFVTDGLMGVGNRTLEPGTALAIDANTTYSFDVPEGGLAFINFRVTDPSVVLMERGKPLNEPINERENFKLNGALVKRALAEAGL